MWDRVVRRGKHPSSSGKPCNGSLQHHDPCIRTRAEKVRLLVKSDPTDSAYRTKLSWAEAGLSILFNHKKVVALGQIAFSHTMWVQFRVWCRPSSFSKSIFLDGERRVAAAETLSMLCQLVSGNKNGPWLVLIASTDVAVGSRASWGMATLQAVCPHSKTIWEVNHWRHRSLGLSKKVVFGDIIEKSCGFLLYHNMS